MKLFPTTNKAKDPILWGVLILFFVLFVASILNHPLSLEKSLRVWLVLSASLIGIIVTLTAIFRLNQLGRIMKQIILLGLITLVLLEISGFLFPKIWPLQILLRTPNWVQEFLGEDAFISDSFRPMLDGDYQNDPDLAYRYASNLDFEIVQGEIRYRQQTDKHGFRVLDPTLYSKADIVVTGDSYTAGSTVNIADTWPNQLSDITGSRVLNLGQGGWSLFQYPRVLTRYASSSSPNQIIIGLHGTSDLTDDWYKYEDFKQLNPNIRGYRDFRDSEDPIVKENSQLKNGQYIRVLFEMTRNVVPFTTTSVDFITRPKTPTCEFTLGQTRFQFPFNEIEHLKNNYQTEHADKITRDFNNIKTFAKTNEIKLYFFYLPLREEIYIPLLESATELNDCSKKLKEDYANGKFKMNQFYSYIQTMIGEEASDNLFNVTPYLQRHAIEGEQLSWNSDSHPNALGYQRIAEYISTKIDPSPK